MPVSNSRKLQRGHPNPPSRGRSPQELDAWPQEYNRIPALTSQTDVTRAAYAKGKLHNQHVHMLLDSGASCSVVDKDFVTVDGLKPMRLMKLTNADGRGLTAIGQTTMRVTLHDITTSQRWLSIY